MVLCPNCGAQVEGRFCARCGTAVTQAASAGASSYGATSGGTGMPPPANPAYGSAPVATSGGLSDNIAGLLCYAPFVGLFADILFLVIEPYNRNRFIRFHAFQSLFLIGGLIVFHIALSIVTTILVKILTIFALIMLPILLLVGLAEFGLFCWLMYKAYLNEKWMVPIIGPLAEKQANS